MLSPKANITPSERLLYTNTWYLVSQDLSAAYKFLTHPRHSECCYPLLFTPNRSFVATEFINIGTQESHLARSRGLSGLTLTSQISVWFQSCCITEINASFCSPCSNTDKSRKFCPSCYRLILAQPTFSPGQVTNNP